MLGVRVLVAPDTFGSILTAREVAATVAAGWRDVAPADALDECPLADGGPGFVDTLHAALGGRLLPVTVPGPLGEPTPATLLLVDEPAGRTAYVESAQAVGLPLVPEDRRDPGRTTTRGVGALLVAARDAGARRVVVGLGGSSTNDAGAGMLVGAGLEVPAGLLDAGGGALGAVTAADLVGLRDLRARWRDVELVAATDVDVPLLGLTGASAGFAPQKGASPEQAQELERCLGSFAHAATTALADELRPDLLAGSRPTSAATRLTAAAGAGAAGGLGFGLALLGARVVPGGPFVADRVRLDERLAAADVVVTGEGRFDWQSLHGKVATEVAARALRHGIPTVVLAGEVQVGRRELSAAGITAAYAVGETPEEVRAALADPVATLRARAARVARTWSR
ncbi:glycerate kinase [Cellulomonas fimi]|uniref:Glycerate kinase n=1 Tax=Cellulomonas fimi (strain ATCC 484 / DSM 20113 / JCM 1341 / CCUG 24087 / LMG 16345 / NBRC 15513 / NCIMB 8980 / NCTC 7547 / NRS-133) TaxID=590998 RepID=F4H1M3_CELFA|nr:glycerate kinase [Cellulomonas fimi]AEE46322.1 glycerate kinase [Cellulomonas fimi ATCC 484]NNH08488.1 glycerate kinase [Cellulomonas fimi]VEH32522.1 Glycerate kinase [Cellulomonas fimi]